LLQQKKNSQHYIKSFFTLIIYKKIYKQSLLSLNLININEDAIHSLLIIMNNDNNDNDNDFEAENSDIIDVLSLFTCHFFERSKKRRIHDHRVGLPYRTSPSRAEPYRAFSSRIASP